MFGVLLGSIISTVGTIAISYITKKSEERRNYRELAVKWGVESWRMHMDGAGKKGGTVPPVEDYILHALLTSDTLADSKHLSDEAIVQALQKKSVFLRRIREMRENLDKTTENDRVANTTSDKG